MIFVDFRSKQKEEDFNLIFPDWESGENVAFLSPHDDDVLLGAGYLLTAVLKHGGFPLVMIMCKGDAGYSNEGEKYRIVDVRKDEALSAYGRLGVPPFRIHFLDIPDFSLMPHVNRMVFENSGLFLEQIRIFRQEKITRVVFSSGYFEHWDHTAVYYMGIYNSPQAGDPVLVDLGEPQKVKSYIVYSVWGDFAPSFEKENELRATKGILADEDVEEKITTAIKDFNSQEKIFAGIMDHRKKRKCEQGYLELYQDVEVRKPTDFNSYFDALKKIQDI